MNNSDRYIRQLEELIANKLLPVYNKYYEVTNQTKPVLDLPVAFIPRQIPALFKRGFGATLVPRNSKKPN
jgi:hypothetical protein